MIKVSYEPMGAQFTVHAPKIMKKTKAEVIKSLGMTEEDRKSFGHALTVAQVGPLLKSVNHQ